jgi:uncharacterized protein (TIGR00369 family)
LETKEVLSNDGGDWAVRNSACFVCGDDNPKGLHVAFTQQEDAACAEWMPGREWESYPGTIHGGILSSILDEAMAKAILAKGWVAFTVELNVRYKKSVAPGEPLQIRGWVVAKQRRRILAEAAILNAGGVECTHAQGTFLEAPKK